MIQSPPRLSPFSNPERAKERRNVVLQAMADAGFITAEAADRASQRAGADRRRARSRPRRRTSSIYVSQELAGQVRGDREASRRRLHDARPAPAAHGAGRRPRRADAARRDPRASASRQPAQAALIAVDPRTGEILALVGGRSYNQSQYNRAINARRQPGSVFKPFVYLAAFEQAQARRPHRPHAGDDRRRRADDLHVRTTSRGIRGNYEGEYDGPMTLRRALALSRNIATIKVAETTGYERGRGALAPGRHRHAAAGPIPSIALGVFEATPLEIADGLHGLRQRRHDPAAARRSRASSSGGQDVPIENQAPKTDRPARTRPSSSPT